jgi:hypothetical protein
MGPVNDESLKGLKVTLRGHADLLIFGSTLVEYIVTDRLGLTSPRRFVPHVFGQLHHCAGNRVSFVWPDYEIKYRSDYYLIIWEGPLYVHRIPNPAISDQVSLCEARHRFWQ